MANEIKTNNGDGREFAIADTLTSSPTKVPTSKAVADYVAANAGGGGSAKSVFLSSCNGEPLGIDGSVTRTIAVAGILSPTDAEWQRVIHLPYACTLSHLRVSIGDTHPSGGTLVFTLRKNGSNTLLVVTVPSPAYGSSYSNTSDSVTCAAGDYVTIRVVNNNSSVSAPIVGVSLVVTI